MLLSAGANVDFVDDTGRSCLLLAVEDGFYEISVMLLENGADVDLRQPRDGATPLLRAAADGSPDLCSLLLRRGADVNAQTHSGTFALLMAALQGHGEVASVLMWHGADVNQVELSAGHLS